MSFCCRRRRSTMRQLLAFQSVVQHRVDGDLLPPAVRACVPRASSTSSKPPRHPVRLESRKNRRRREEVCFRDQRLSVSRLPHRCTRPVHQLADVTTGPVPPIAKGEIWVTGCAIGPQRNYAGSTDKVTLKHIFKFINIFERQVHSNMARSVTRRVRSVSCSFRKASSSF